jgi:hypothetical protein
MLKNSIGYDEAVDALVLGLVTRENVMLIGPRGTAFALLVNTLTKLVQAQLTTSAEASSDVLNALRRLVFVKNPPNQPLEEWNAWIVIVATDEEASMDKPSAS